MTQSTPVPPPSAFPVPRPGYHWLIVVVGVLIMATIFGTIVNAFSLFTRSVTGEITSITPAQFAYAYGIITFIAIPLSPLVGNLLKKVDAHYLISAGVVVAAVANIGLSQTHGLTWLYCMAAVQGVAVTLATTIPLSTIVTNWFIKHRGMALGLTMGGSGLGALVFVPLINNLLLNVGWRRTYLIMAAIQLVLMLPLAVFVLRSKPEQRGLLPLGYGEGTMPQAANPQDRPGLTQREIYRTPAFWVLGLALVFAGISVNGMIANFAPILTALQAPKSVFIGILTTVGIFVMLGKFLTGFIFDKLGLMPAIILIALANAAQFIFMLNPHDMVRGTLFNILHGFGATMVTVTPAYLAAKLFGEKDYSAVYGSVSIFAMLGAAIAPIFGGLFFGGKATSGFGNAQGLVWAWLVMGLIGLAFYIVTVLIRPRWENAHSDARS